MRCNGAVNVYVTSFALMCVAFLSGCKTMGGAVAGEKVEIVLLTPDDLDSYPSGKTEGLGTSESFFAFLNDVYKDKDGNPQSRYKNNWSMIKKPWAEQQPRAELRSAGLVPLVGFLAGAAIDFVSTSLKEEANRHESQFGKSTVYEGYWRNFGQANDTADWRPQYAGVAVERWLPKPDSKSMPKEMELVSSSIVLLIPSSDHRLAIMQPFFYGTTRSRALVASEPGTMATDLELTIDDAWLDKTSKFASERVGTLQATWTGYSMLKPEGVYRTDWTSQGAGWFGGVRRSQNEKGEEVGGGTFRVAARVTERDESHAKEVIEKGAKYISDNRDAWTKALTGSLSGK